MDKSIAIYRTDQTGIRKVVHIPKVLFQETHNAYRYKSKAMIKGYKTYSKKNWTTDKHLADIRERQTLMELNKKKLHSIKLIQNNYNVNESRIEILNKKFSDPKAYKKENHE